MVKTFDRYVFKEVAIPFGIGLSVYTFSLLINQILRLSNLFVSKGAGLETIFKFLIYLLPDFLSFTIPMSTLMGVLAGISRMSTDSEITAFKTMGISNLRLYRPVFVFTFLMWIISSLLTMFIAPKSNYELRKLRADVGISQAVKSIKPKTFYDDFPGYVIYFEDVDRSTDEWKNVFLYFREGGQKDKVILAKRGTIIQEGKQLEKKDANNGLIKRKDAFFSLKDATIFSFNRENPEKDNSIVFYSYFNKHIANRNDGFKVNKGSTQLSLPELFKKIEILKKDEKLKNSLSFISLETEYHNKFTLPLACIAFGILGLALGISTNKGGKISGFIISLAIIFIFYSITVIGRNMITKKQISVITGMWTPIIFLFLTGIILFVLTLKEKKIRIDKVFALVEKIKIRFFSEKKTLFILKIKKTSFRVFNILDIYIIKKLSLIFIFIFISIIIIFFVINIIELADDAIENGVSFALVLNYVIYIMPEILNYIFPVSILTTVLLTFSIMSKNNEIVAVQVSGISLYRLVLPAIIFGIVVSSVSFFVQEYITPDANKKALVLFNKIHKRNKKVSHELQRNWVVDNKRQFFFYQAYNKKTNLFHNFGKLEFDENFKLKKRVYAKYAKWTKDKELTLQDGFEKTFVDNSPIANKNFGPFIINTHLSKDVFLNKKAKLKDMISKIPGLNRYKVELPGNRFVFFEDYDGTKFINFSAAFFDGGYRIEKLINSKTAKWLNRSEIELNNANIIMFARNSSSLKKPVLPSLKIHIDDGKDFFKKKIISSQFMNISSLKKYISYLKKSNSDTIRYEAKLYYKYAFPISSLIMVLLAIPFSFLMGNKGAVYGIGLAVGLSMIYWTSFGIFSALGSAAILSPFISAFAPILVFASLSLYSFSNLKT